MTLSTAVIKHTYLALRLKHDGRGMPTQLPAACVLVSAYVLLNLINLRVEANVTAHALLGLFLVASCYLLCLKNKLIGLLVLISIISNAMALLLNSLFGVSALGTFVLTSVEYLMIFGALMNVIKSEIQST